MGLETWTKERIALLRSLWADGITSREIAVQLGVTRGMVAGKRFGLGLPPRDGVIGKLAQGLNAKRTAGLCGHVTPPEVAARKTAAVMALEALVKPLEGSNPRPWELRLPWECAFPVAGYGGDTLSCCLGREPGSPYCYGHRELVAGRPWPPLDPDPDLAATQYA